MDLAAQPLRKPLGMRPSRACSWGCCVIVVFVIAISVLSMPGQPVAQPLYHTNHGGGPGGIPHDVVPPLHLTPLNSMPPHIRSRFDTLLRVGPGSGYIVYPIDGLRVLHTTARARRDAPLRRQRIAPNSYDIVSSGTFYWQNRPLGTIIRDGQFDILDDPKAPFRGAVAVLSDGTIVLGRSWGHTLPEIRARFGQRGKPVRHFMGGGALLIENDRILGSNDLFQAQRFTQNGQGINARQFNPMHHILLGIRRGQAYLILALGRNGRRMQKDLARSPFFFSTVVMFDGGSGCYLRAPTPSGRTVERRDCDKWNPSGFGIILRRR